MKTSTLVSVFVIVLLVLGGWYAWMHMGSLTMTPSPSPETGGTGVPVANVGEHCGGNMANAPVCADGSHCAPDPNSNLPFGDVGGVCTADTDNATTSAAAPGSSAAYVPGNLLLGTDANAKLGTYLIASNGMTLYRYTKDSPGVSNCSGECAVKWPPYTVASTDVLANVQAGIGGKVGTIKRADGSLQVTYKGSPLYFWVNDAASGDTTGQGVGGVWFVVAP